MRTLVVILLLVVPARALAQHDHGHMHMQPDGAAPQSEHRVEAGLVIEGATIEDGAWQGASPKLAWSWRWLGAGVVVPAYRLDRGDPTLGLGDVVVSASVQRSRDGVEAGAMIAVSAPTGDADVGLGMGHPMGMPGGWLGWTAGRLRVHAMAMLSKELGDDPHAHHRHVYVNPMNPFEVGGTARAGYAATPSLRIDAIGSLAVPIGEGATRATAGAGARWRAASWTAAAEAQLGVAGDPFTARLALELAHVF